MTIFLCLQIEDFKRPHRDGSTSLGKCCTMYTVVLNAQGRPIWKRNGKPLYWAVGYGYAGGYDEAKVRNGMPKRWPSLADAPYISTANPGKLVSKSEAQKLLGKHWLPHAALDYLTEQLKEQQEREPLPETPEQEAETNGR